MSLFDLDDRVTAAIIAAIGTVIGALIQLRIAWRKQMTERARGTPVTKKSRRGPVLAVFVLLIAAGVGGFAFSQYLMAQSNRDSAALRGEMQMQLAQISATAERLERVQLRNRGSNESEAQSAEDARRGAEGVAATTTVGPCRARAAQSSGNAERACSEQDALQVTLCASVPSSAAVTDVALYARPADAQQSWTESLVTVGQDVGRARFTEKPVERAESDQTKLVCANFASWDGERAQSARLVVKYSAALPAPTREMSHAAVTPAAERIP